MLGIYRNDDDSTDIMKGMKLSFYRKGRVIKRKAALEIYANLRMNEKGSRRTTRTLTSWQSELVTELLANCDNFNLDLFTLLHLSNQTLSVCANYVALRWMTNWNWCGSHLPEVTEKNVGKLSEHSLCPSLDSNSTPPKYKLRSLALHQLARLKAFKHRCSKRFLLFTTFLKHTCLQWSTALGLWYERGVTIYFPE
jgi:hypothetical protein